MTYRFSNVFVRVVPLAFALVAFGVVDAGALVVRQSLSPVGSDGDASGSARLEVRGRGARRRATLVVKVTRLAPDGHYEVTVDGVRIGSLDTSSRGKGRARFATRPRRDDQLLGVDPRGRAIAVVGSDSAVLGARLDDRGLDPNDVRCCLPDDSGPECEDRTAAECAAQGGIDLGAGSCLPNPCAGTSVPGDGDIRCCIPDDSGPECEDRTAAACAAQGGINLGPGSCTPNPCGPSTSTSTTLPGGGTPSVQVSCERRADRSKISVDGRGLAPGSYTATVASGASSATSAPRTTVGDQVEFDFDSDGGDIAAGATPIAAGFITADPAQVTGRILDGTGSVVAEATVACTVR